MYTWAEIQIETCKKMFLNSDIISVDDINTLRTNNNYKTYFNGMAQAANEGISEILKRGKPYIKTFSFTRNNKDNLLGRMFKVIDHVDEDIVFETDRGLSYYFEVDNESTVRIYVDNVLVETVENEPESVGTYTVYKNFLPNTDNKPVRIEFSGVHPYHIRNVCINKLNYNYGDEDDTDYIPNYTNEDVIDLSSVVSDFYKIIKFYVNKKEMINNTDYKMADTYTMVLANKDLDGEFIIKYQCYPERITDETDDDYELPLEQEMAVLLPLYMASELYKDDDVSLATMYRNEFEAMVDSKYPTHEDLQFISKTGWL